MKVPQRPRRPTPAQLLATGLVFIFAATLQAQWEIQPAPTIASLRGIHNVGNGIAWASGTEGTVLRTTDDGTHWQRCPTPPAADHLDFRGIQAFNAQTAIVMSSGKGDLSRLYKTTDACQTWKLLFTNPNPTGFFDSFNARPSANHRAIDAMIAGDPVSGSFTLFELSIPWSSSGSSRLMPFPIRFCHDQKAQLQLPLPISPCVARLISLTQGGIRKGKQQPAKPADIPAGYKSPVPRPGETLFAASNSALSLEPSVWFSPNIAFVTGGPEGPRFIQYRGWPCAGFGCESWRVADVPLSAGDSSGAFSVAAIGRDSWQGVIVGGDYRKPDEMYGTGAYTEDEGENWKPCVTPPHGYRSSVAYDPTTKTWITVGPNGTDISTDDGRNWRALKPNPNNPTPPDNTPEDQSWNALSLPFVVGPHGHIGKLRPDAIPVAPATSKAVKP